MPRSHHLLIRRPATHGLLLGLLLAVWTRSALGQARSIVGSWRGSSTCVDKIRFPACHDEIVIYDIRALPGTSDTVMLRADKLAHGAREFMYQLPFAREADSAWSAEFRSPRGHGRWVLQVRGSLMSGRLLDLPSLKVVREMSLERIGAAEPADSGSHFRRVGSLLTADGGNESPGVCMQACFD